MTYLSNPLMLLLNVAFSAIGPGILITIGVIVDHLLGSLAKQPSWEWLGHRPQFRLFTAIAVWGIPAGLILPGSFLFFLIAMVGIVWFAIPALVLIGAVALITRRRARPRVPYSRMAVAVSASAVALGMAYGTGTLMAQWEIASAQSYVARVMPMLDQIKAAKGEYPPTLPVSTVGMPPALLRVPESYHSDGKVFHFSYSNPGAFLGEGEQIDSATRTWSYFDPMD